MNRAAIYCRLSVEDEDKKGEVDSESINNQKLLLVEYAMNHNLDIYRIYVDDNYSGLNENRPSFQHLIEDAKGKKFDMILCKTQSRFTRDMVMVEKYIHGLLPELGIRFIGVLDHVDSEDKGNKRARQINGLVNEWYCEELSDNIRLVLNKKRTDGEFIGSFAPFGYKKSSVNKHYLEIDSEAAEIVRTIYQLYLADYSVRGICEYLTCKNISTPNQYRRMTAESMKQNKNYEDWTEENLGENKSDNKEKNYGENNDPISKQWIEYTKNRIKKTDKDVWAASTVKKILHSEVYLGHMIQGKERNLSYKNHKRIKTQKDEWYIKFHTHEPILTTEIYEKVQNKMNKRKKSQQNNRYSKEDVFVGKVICSQCQKIMYKTSGNKSNHKYFHCSTYANSKGRDCIKNAIRSDELSLLVEEEIMELIEKEISSNFKWFLNLVSKVLHNSENSKNEQHALTFEIRKIEEEMSICKESILNIYLDKAKGMIKEELSCDMIGSLNTKIESLQLKKLEFMEQMKQTSNYIDILYELQSTIKSMDDYELQKINYHNKTKRIQMIEDKQNEVVIHGRKDKYVEIVNQFIKYIINDQENKRMLISELIESIEIQEIDKNRQNIIIHWRI